MLSRNLSPLLTLVTRWKLRSSGWEPLGGVLESMLGVFGALSWGEGSWGRFEFPVFGPSWGPPRIPREPQDSIRFAPHGLPRAPDGPKNVQERPRRSSRGLRANPGASKRNPERPRRAQDGSGSPPESADCTLLDITGPYWTLLHLSWGTCQGPKRAQ